MAIKSKGRGTAAALGLFLLFAGLVGGGVLFVVSERRPSQAIERFARAPVGCTTTLEFSEIGVFYIYEEAGSIVEPVEGGCQPFANPASSFTVEFTGALEPAAAVDDESITYDVDGFDGRSVQRIEITEPGEYDVEVTGDDLTVVAALGRDPATDVDELRRAALTIAVAGVVLGLLLLILAGRRSKRAAVVGTPEGPGWGPSTAAPSDRDWPPQAPQVGQVPVNPHLPPEPAVLIPPAPPLPERPKPTTWGPPTGEAEELPPPTEEEAPTTRRLPDVQPTLPNTPGTASGTSPNLP